MKNKIGKALLILGILLAIIEIVTQFLGYTSNIPFFPATYFAVSGILLLTINERNCKYAFLGWTTAFMVFFVCYASYGINFLPVYIIDMALSLYIYLGKSYTDAERKFSYAGMGLVLASCCCFVTGYFFYLDKIAIIIEVFVIFRNLIRRKSIER